MDRFGLPRVSLGFFPTPLVELVHLSRNLGGPRIFMKRDDHTGLAFGGNKTRKLELILGDALEKGADTILTAGAAQSNHCRQTAAAAAALQLRCHLVLGGQAPETPEGNLLLDRIFGCRIHWCGPNRKGEDIPRIAARLKSDGRRPYAVPYGGSNELGATAFVLALMELEGQLEQLGESITHIVFASSSGGTHAGLMVGKRLLAASYRLVGINIDKDEAGESPFDQFILSLANRTARFLDTGLTFTKKDLCLNSEYVGGGYGVVGELEREAIRLTARNEGILLDPVYTGRAMGGLIDMIRSGALGPDERIVFWHTGGTPGLFAYPHEITRNAFYDGNDESQVHSI